MWDSRTFLLVNPECGMWDPRTNLLVNPNPNEPYGIDSSNVQMFNP